MKYKEKMTRYHKWREKHDFERIIKREQGRVNKDRRWMVKNKQRRRETTNWHEDQEIITIKNTKDQAKGNGY